MVTPCKCSGQHGHCPAPQACEQEDLSQLPTKQASFVFRPMHLAGYIAVMVACLLTACGDASPMQGPGALWLHERGSVRCVNVQSITFIASRWVQYVEAGETKETGVPIDYRRGESCPAA